MVILALLANLVVLQLLTFLYICFFILISMPTIIDLGVEHNHIESLTKASGITAFCELIWNAIDADATEIHINYKKNGLCGYNEIEIIDNGHGLQYETQN